MISTPEALARVITTVSGATYRNESGANERTYDARGWTTNDPALYPASVGKTNTGLRTAWIGGKVIGPQSTALTWREMKQTYDGCGVLIKSNDWAIIDGFRARNVMDGLRVTAPGSTFRISNCWIEDCRDDFLENDQILGGELNDCLVDGCFVFLSERGATWDGSAEVTISDSLVRLGMYPFDVSTSGNVPAVGSIVDGKGTGMPFKWQASGGTPLTVTNTIIYVPNLGVNGAASMNFPTGTYSNVTLIWTGGGSYPGTLPGSGVTVSTDVTIWDRAVADWKTRHGVANFDTVDMGRLLAPTAPPTYPV